jgi:anti-sigma factor RsiW
MKSLTNHLSQDLILRMLDDELPMADRLECENHLALCEPCRQEVASLHGFSMQIETAVQLLDMPDMGAVRQQLETLLAPAPAVVHNHPGRIMRRFGWGMGIAATLAFGILMAPRHDLSPQAEMTAETQTVSAPQPAAIEVDGETFSPVPYSNSDLTTAAPHIVQMQVPVSSLADIGIVLEPVTNRASETERSVLADVLVGADGQPRGVHVLGFE